MEESDAVVHTPVRGLLKRKMRRSMSKSPKLSTTGKRSSPKTSPKTAAAAVLSSPTTITPTKSSPKTTPKRVSPKDASIKASSQNLPTPGKAISITSQSPSPRPSPKATITADVLAGVPTELTEKGVLVTATPKNLQSTPNIKKSLVPATPTPKKVAVPKALSLKKMIASKTPSPKIVVRRKTITPKKAGTPKARTPKKSVTPKAITPKKVTTLKMATPKTTVGPETLSPKKITSPKTPSRKKAASPDKLATPKRTTPKRLASPKVDSLKGLTPKQASVPEKTSVYVQRRSVSLLASKVTPHTPKGVVSTPKASDPKTPLSSKKATSGRVRSAEKITRKVNKTPTPKKTPRVWAISLMVDVTTKSPSSPKKTPANRVSMSKTGTSRSTKHAPDSSTASAAKKLKGKLHLFIFLFIYRCVKTFEALLSIYSVVQRRNRCLCVNITEYVLERNISCAHKWEGSHEVTCASW